MMQGGIIGEMKVDIQKNKGMRLRKKEETKVGRDIDGRSEGGIKQGRNKRN